MIVNSLLQIIEQSSLFGYLFFLLIFFLESIAFLGYAIPGTVFLVLAGFLSSRDILNTEILLLIIMFSIIVGDGISFYFGRKGKDIFKLSKKSFGSKYLEKAEVFFEKHGHKSVFLGRFIGPIRPLVCFIAGIFKMNTAEFYAINFFGAVIWSGVYFVFGYFFGQAFRMIEVWSTRVGLFLLFLFIFFVILYSIKRFIISKSSPVFFLAKSISASMKKAVAENEGIRRIRAKYPAFFGFLSGRLSKASFTGLPLTLLTIAFLYVVFLFIGVVEDVFTSDLIVSADLRINNLLKIFRSPILIKIFLWITVFGKWQLIVFFTVIFSSMLWLWHRRYYILPLWATIFGSMAFSFLGKLAFKRMRPEGAVYFEDSFSFPSGHATMAMAFYGFLVYFFVRNLKSWKQKVNAFFLFFVIIILVDFSRLYLGVHYLSDVWAGFLLGLLWLIIGIIIGEWIFSKVSDIKKKVPAQFEKIIDVVAGEKDAVFDNAEIAAKNRAALKIRIVSLFLAAISVLMYYFAARAFNPLPENAAEPAAGTVKSAIEIFRKEKWKSPHLYLK